MVVRAGSGAGGAAGGARRVWCSRRASRGQRTVLREQLINVVADTVSGLGDCTDLSCLVPGLHTDGMMRRPPLAFGSCEGEAPSMAAGHGGPAGSGREGVDMTVKTESAAARRPGTRVSGRGPARAAAEERLSRADRVARGKDARAVAPLESHGEFRPGRSRDPVGLLLGQADVAGAGAGAGAARADAGVPVHVLPGGGAADGGGPGRNSHVGAAGAAVRGCAPVQFRRVRVAASAPAPGSC